MKKIQAKTNRVKPQHSTSPEILSKTLEWWQVMSDESFCYFPSKDQWRERLIHTMNKYFEDPERLELDEFCIDYKIDPETLRNWRNKYEDIGKAVRRIKIFIGVRRRLGVHRHKYLAQSCYKDMHTLEPTWAIEVDKYWSDIKKAEDQVKQDFNINMIKAEKPKDKDA